ncbi:HDOD domain protein [Stieleria neptunia]|uniref:HDOD domain protein n=1 Tax=Stieleria neptunia TaxID=2527979 RepID=A0A518HTA3_9BACT|nr:HDOD domain-containing protein [Stieleria neptunia]QDV44041.1 HDOD domain protein [Stieleria neptunia]
MTRQTMTGSSTIERIEALIDRPELLHSPPEVAQSLLQLTKNDDFSLHEIVDCIRADPAMSSRVLHVVNSSRYGLKTSVTNLHQAVSLLGERSVRLIAMTFSIANAFSTGAARELYNDFWRQALTTAAAARRLAVHLDGVDHNDAYTTGLLSHLGTLVFAQVEGEKHLSLYRSASGQRLVHLERREYDIDHVDIGARVLSKWQFPDVICDAVRTHLNPDLEDPLAVAVHGGTLITDALWYAGDESIAACRGWLKDRFNVTIDEFIELALECRDEVQLELEVYGVDADMPVDPEELLEQARQRYMESSLTTALDFDSYGSVFGED